VFRVDAEIISRPSGQRIVVPIGPAGSDLPPRGGSQA
jgi:hypothetical protein